MKKTKKSFQLRLKTTIVTLVILCSLITIMPQLGLASSTTPEMRLSKTQDLTCGEIITWYISNNSFEKGDDFLVKIWNGSTFNALKTTEGEADDYGNLALSFRVPGWSEIGQNPIGSWNVSIWKDASTDELVTWTNTTIIIENLYYLKFFHHGEEIDHLLYNSSYSQADFQVNIYNWTGSKLVLQDQSDHQDFNGRIYKIIDGTTYIEESRDNIDDGTWEVGFQINENDVDIPNYEIYYWFNLTNKNNEAYYSNITLPILLNMTCTCPTDATWGDKITINGYIQDGNGEGISNYDFHVYAPNNDGGYTLVSYDDTDFSGYYSASIQTGSGETGCAGTWYVGTYETDETPRVNKTDEVPYIPGFIPYASFTVGSKDAANIRLESPDEIISGFNQPINISIKKEEWMKESEYQHMNIHITGLPGYNQTVNEPYDEADMVQVIDATTYTPTLSSDEEYAYYTFSYQFNSTGTATIWASYEKNLTAIKDSSSTNPVSGFYTEKYGHSDLKPNITASKTIMVQPADEMNLVIDGTMVDSVQVQENPGSCTNDQWINESTSFILHIFGENTQEMMNASIHISGCGLNISIDETNPSDTKECKHYPGDGIFTKGQYQIQISPKTAGTLTITATNKTTGKSVSEDYTITGLTGMVSTSNNDDLKLTVGSTEAITVDITNGEYAEVTLTYFDTEWTKTNTDSLVINNTVGNAKTGTGLNGQFTFIPDEEDVDQLGYIVVVAKAGGNNYFYDIIEIEPVYDLEINLLSPAFSNATPTLTVGLKQDIVFQLIDSSGSIVEENDPWVTVKLIDENHDEDNPLLTWSSEITGGWTIDQNGDEWEIEDLQPFWTGQLVISGQNNTNGIAHAGKKYVDVDYATITYNPTAATAGIGTENLTISVTGVDANGNPLPDGTQIYFWCNQSIDAIVGGSSDYENGVDFKNTDTSIVLTDGQGSFILRKIGDQKTQINATLSEYNPAKGNNTQGTFRILFPTFNLDPETAFIDQSNMITITATDYQDNPIEGIYLTFVSSSIGILTAQPDPVKTNADGSAVLSINPQASGKLNVTIARNVRYENGQLTWGNAVITDSYLTVTSMKKLQIALSGSPLRQEDILTVTVTAYHNPIVDVIVEFAGTIEQTDMNGQATFMVPDPIVESATYTITAEKTGYELAEKTVTVIKTYSITIIPPNNNPVTGESFSVTILAKGSALAGATVEFNGETYTSSADGSVLINSPEKKGEYPVTASYEGYLSATENISVDEPPIIPGFELLYFIVAIGLASFIALMYRRNKHKNQKK